MSASFDEAMARGLRENRDTMGGVYPPLTRLIDLIYQPGHQVPWPELWLTMAQLVAKRSRCSSDQVGAVLVSADEVMLATGYNGASRDYPQHDVDGDGTGSPWCQAWCERAAARARGDGVAAGYVDCPSVHAEANVLLRAPAHAGESALYTSRLPCFGCAKLIGAARATRGITAVHVSRHGMGDRNHEHQASMDLLERCGVDVRVW